MEVLTMSFYGLLNSIQQDLVALHMCDAGQLSSVSNILINDAFGIEDAC